jgi:hypothetical protein
LTLTHLDSAAAPEAADVHAEAAWAHLTTT